MRLFAILVFGFALARPADAEPTYVRYMGEVSCGTWLQTKGQLPGLPARAIPLNLILGILDGYGLANGVSYLDNIDPASVAVWMDNYCTSNPLSSVVDGSFKLIEELDAKRRGKNRN
jgi:hypothetical protein